MEVVPGESSRDRNSRTRKTYSGLRILYSGVILFRILYHFEIKSRLGGNKRRVPQVIMAENKGWKMQLDAWHSEEPACTPLILPTLEAE